MNKKDQLTPEEYKRIIHVLTPFTLGRRVDDQYHFRTIRAKMKRQLASLENNGGYSKLVVIRNQKMNQRSFILKRSHLQS